MSTTTPASEPSRPRPKSQRILACILCQQRKVKCDRRFPCANCVRHQVQCVPATQTRPRRRRFPERELLDRLRKYEDLLRRNKVKFEPLHKDPGSGEQESPEGSYGSDHEQLEAVGVNTPSSSTTKSESTYEAKNIWQAMAQGSRDPNHDVREVIFRNAWDQTFGNDDNILFGSRQSSVDLSTLHPEPVHIFRLWQAYLDNVNPLLKVTHTPSLQGRIIEAASNLKNVNPTMEALMFGIYCMAILSLAPEDCQSHFHLSKPDLLTKFQFGCQQALLNSAFLRTEDRDCLTALFLYLHSSRSGAHPRSVSTILAVAIRIAERMGIQTEAINARYTVLEAEMRRRLWWSLMLFDARMSGLSDHKPMILAPTWDCAIPLNVSDSDLREETKEPPPARTGVSEAFFAVVRSELGESIRHTRFHLDFTNPALKTIAKELPDGGNLDALERMVEEKYLKFCDQENALQYMTMWTTRAQLSNCRLLENYSRHLDSVDKQGGEPGSPAISHALRWLECDTKIASSPLTKGYIWFTQLYFPFPAYIRIAQDLKAQPLGSEYERAWEIMSDNYDARFGIEVGVYNPVFIPFSNFILHAWGICEEASKESGKPMALPRIVTRIRQTLEALSKNANSEPDTTSMDDEDLSVHAPAGFGDPSMLFGMGPGGHAGVNSIMYNNMRGQPPFAVDSHHLDWTSMDWSLGGGRGW
ncbi:hypothetical protein CEP51_001671 [Fusarium floridanum]|uniref:Zn(2)-C6 fungal-type domain-containing protein n=1 Tax=Fusarium floridanum TaxID=1325733 RepID=A0A428SFM6_9HYPO|nr:hypothetical protein CEP51_001671 [Fusarium floridanum]